MSRQARASCRYRHGPLPPLLGRRDRRQRVTADRLRRRSSSGHRRCPVDQMRDINSPLAGGNAVSPIRVRGRNLGLTVVVVLVEVVEQARPGWLPSEHLAGVVARGGAVRGQQEAQEPEVVQCVVGGDRYDRNVELAPNDLGEVSACYALLGYRMEGRAGRCLLLRRTGRLEPHRAGGWRASGPTRLRRSPRHLCLERHPPGWP